MPGTLDRELMTFDVGVLVGPENLFRADRPIPPASS
jgi:hypothetical protein